MTCKDCKYSRDIGTALLCWGQRFAPPVDADNWCEGWKPKSVTPQTNADRIRQMTDEELANFLFENVDCSSCQMHGGGCSVDCEKWMLSWLKSPEVDNEK